MTPKLCDARTASCPVDDHEDELSVYIVYIILYMLYTNRTSIKRAGRAVNLGVRASVRRAFVLCDGVVLRDAVWSLREYSFVSEHKA
eukprot:1444506-Pleurochrysis_carterae.AAC.2